MEPCDPAECRYLFLGSESKCHLKPPPRFPFPPGSSPADTLSKLQAYADRKTALCWSYQEEMKLHTLKPATDPGPEQHLGAEGEEYLQGQHKDSKSRSALWFAGFGETAGMCKYFQRKLVPGEHEHTATGWAAPREKMLETRKTVLEALVKQ